MYETCDRCGPAVDPLLALLWLPRGLLFLCALARCALAPNAAAAASAFCAG